MFKAADRDKRVVVLENMNKKKKKKNKGGNDLILEREDKELQNVSLFNLIAIPQSSSLPSPSSSFSSSGGSLSNGVLSPDDASLYPFVEESFVDKCQSVLSLGAGYSNFNGSVGLRDGNGRLVDELDLSQNFYRLSVNGEGEERNKGFGFGLGGIGDGVSVGNGNVGCRVLGYGCYRGGGFGNEGFGVGSGSFQSSSSPQVVPFGSSDGSLECRFNDVRGGFGFGGSNSGGNYFGHDQSDGVFSGSGWCTSQSDFWVEQRKEQGSDWVGNEGINMLGGTNPIFAPYVNGGFVCSSQCSMNSSGGRGPVDSLGSPLLVPPELDLSVYNPVSKLMMLKGRSNGVPQTVMLRTSAGDLKAFGCEDGLIIEGNRLHYDRNKVCDQLKEHTNVSFNELSEQNLQERSVKFDGCNLFDGTFDNGQSLGSYSSLPAVAFGNSLGEIQGYIYLMAQDQNGCRFLQKIFNEGTSRDVEIIFNELIDNIVELMLKPFGNYVIQKLLDVCNEEQRLQVVRMVTKEPGKLVGICLNTYGTRVVQKLIETLKTKQQISLVILALKPGFLDLIKDQNGNHVIQRCLQHLSNEDNKFIFDAAAKFCAEIATHQHGCCVMQRCIEHSTGKHRDKLIAEICKNGFFLAQDPYGNYVVQFVFDIKSPAVISNLPNLLSQFKGHYVHLSTQKFSSHVVEKCLKNFEESRSQIIRELLTVPHFERLLQHEFANYVIQTALAVTKGPLHSSLVEAVRPHLNLRTSPYCKRIFSRNLLKK